MIDSATHSRSFSRVLSFASLTAIGFALGQASGLVREIVVSAQFGLSAEIDAYRLAFLVPAIVNNIVAGGSITSAVIPVFARYLAEGKRAEFWRVSSVITNVVLLVTGALTVLGMLFAAPIISVFGIGMPMATQAIAAALLIIMMPTLFLSALLNMLLAVLNSLDRFVGRALIFIALNGGIIVTVWLLAPYLGIYALGLGFLFGVLLQVLAQSFELKIEGVEYHFTLDWGHPALRQVGIAFIPIAALSVVSQINLMIDGAMAAGLATGSLGALSYANTILGVFYSLGISLSVAVFPSLSRMATIEDWKGTAHAINLSLRLLTFILAPLAVLTIAFAVPIVSLLLQRGAFDGAAVNRTAYALAMYAPGLIALAILYVLQSAFYALADGRAPLIVGALAVVLHVALNVFLIPGMAHGGIALSTSLTNSIAVIALCVLLARRVPGITLANLFAFLLRCTVLALVSAAPVVWLWLGIESDAWATSALGVALAALGASVYFALAVATGIDESKMLLDYGRRLLARKTTGELTS